MNKPLEIQSPLNFTIQTRALIALIVVNALWGLSFPIMKSLNLQAEQSLVSSSVGASIPMQVALSSGMIGLRFLIALLVLSVVCRSLVFHARMIEWQAGMLIGLFFYIGLVLQVIGLATIPASRSGFLTSLTAVFTPVFAAIFLRQLPSWNVLVGSLLALAGVSVLTGLIVMDNTGLSIAGEATSRWTFGDSMTTLGSMLFTGQILLLDYFGKRMNSSALTPGMFLTVVLGSFMTFVWVHGSGGIRNAAGQQVSLADWGAYFLSPVYFILVIFLAVFCSVCAFLLMNRYQPHISPVQASVVYCSEPVFASLWALVLPEFLSRLYPEYGYANETLTAQLLLGGVLILVANIVALWPTRRRITDT